LILGTLHQHLALQKAAAVVVAMTVTELVEVIVELIVRVLMD
jgi:hypothetical protein